MKVANAKQLPKRYFGLHMAEGVAEYREQGKEPYRIFLNQETITKMNASFEGRPVFVQHVDEVDLKNIQTEADGYVVRSFYNAADGKHWAEFLVVSDKAHEAIKNGWKLSNSYVPKGEMKPGGQWHGVDFQNEIEDGEYDHLAIVNDPRYAESIILTPEEFKQYNIDRELVLKKISNSKEKGESTMFFTKKKVENSADLENTMVALPKSGKEMTLKKLINDMDEVAMKQKENLADVEADVVVGEKKMPLKQLVEEFKALVEKLAAMDEQKDNSESEEEVEESLQNEEDEKAAKEKKENEDKEAKEKADAEEKKKNALAEEKKKNFEKIKNAKDNAKVVETVKVDLAEDRVSRGKSRYGSN